MTPCNVNYSAMIIDLECSNIIIFLVIHDDADEIRSVFGQEVVEHRANVTISISEFAIDKMAE